MYDKKFQSVMSHATHSPSPVTNRHTLADPSLPFEHDVLYGRPLGCITTRSLY